MENRIKLNGLYWEEYEPFDTKVAKIDAWYDRHCREWVIEKLNAEGFQIGDVIRVYDKKTKDMIVKELREKFSV